MIDEYRIDAATTDGTALLSHPRYGRQVWVRGRLRKSCRCAVSGRRLDVGATVWRPVTNQRNRTERISDQVIKDHFSCK